MDDNINSSVYEIRRLNTVEEMKNSWMILDELGYSLDFSTYLIYLDDMSQKGYRQIIVIENTTAIAVLGYWLRTKLWCGPLIELDNIIVKATHRSKGIGKLLCRYIETIAAENLREKIVLDAHISNDGAHRFYFREGYVIDGFHFQKQSK